MTYALTVGVDSVHVAEIAASVRRFGHRYLDRVFTPGEQAACPGTPEQRSRGLAARYAAKEATYKALRPDDLAGPWTAIEIVRIAGGGTDVRLHAAAAAHAEAQGVHDVAVSLTHDHDLATAVAVAVRTAPADPCAQPPARPEATDRTNGKGRSMSDDVIRQVLADHAQLAVGVEALTDSSDLYEAGMTSHASVNVMLGIEDAFDIEFPERLLRKTTFASIASIRSAVAELSA